MRAIGTHLASTTGEVLVKMSFKALVALIGLAAFLAVAITPAQAKLYFGTQDYLRRIQDVDIKGPKGEELYLGYKYSFHSFLLPYSVSVEGHILGVRSDPKIYYRLNDAEIKSLQARGLLPSPLPPYELSALDYAMGYSLWIALIVLAGLSPLALLSKRRRKRAQPYLDEGLAHHNSGNLNEAIESYTKAIDIDPKFAAALHLRGKAYAGLKDFKQSISDQTKAIRIEPKFADALMDRGLLMRITGNFDGAVSDFSRVIKLSKHAGAYFQRGLAYLGKNDFRRAIGDFTTVIKSAPEFADGYRQRAIAYEKSGDAERARADHAMAREISSAQSAAVTYP